MKVQYKRIPPQVFVSHMNDFVRENQLPNFHVSLEWERVDLGDTQEEPETRASLGNYCGISKI